MDKPVIKLTNRIFLHKQTFSVFRNPDFIAWGEKKYTIWGLKGFEEPRTKK